MDERELDVRRLRKHDKHVALEIAKVAALAVAGSALLTN